MGRRIPVMNNTSPRFSPVPRPPPAGRKKAPLSSPLYRARGSGAETKHGESADGSNNFSVPRAPEGAGYRFCRQLASPLPAKQMQFFYPRSHVALDG